MTAGRPDCAAACNEFGLARVRAGGRAQKIAILQTAEADEAN